MGTHKKFFPVAKMPWHTDDHKFGEGEMTWDDVAQKFVPLFEDLEEDFKRCEPLPRLPHKVQFVRGSLKVGEKGKPLPAPPILDDTPYPWGPPQSTVCRVESGKCYYCGDEATTGFRSRLYCTTCWLALNEDLSG